MVKFFNNTILTNYIRIFKSSKNFIPQPKFRAKVRCWSDVRTETRIRAKN